MDPISRSDLRQLIDVEHEACVSIYLPTHRAGADTLQDPIRLKNLIREAEQRLEERGVEPPAIRDLWEPLRELVDQYEFWQHQADGLAIFRSPDIFCRYRVSFPVPELAVVATRFHLKPLLPATEGNQRFYLLALSQDGSRLSAPRVIGPSGISGTSISAVPCRFAVGGRSSRPRFAIFHGHSAGEVDRNQALLPYVRQVDETVPKRPGDEHVPLVLAAMDYLCPIYRQASSNPNLLREEIHGNPTSFTSEGLHRGAWSIASSHFQQDRNKAVDEYHQLWHTQRTSKDLPAIVTASRQGRAKVRFVAVGVQEWGHVDSSTAEVIQAEQRTPQDQDLLNAAAMQTFIAGGTVCAAPPGEVPGRGSVAAIFRY